MTALHHQLTSVDLAVLAGAVGLDRGDPELRDRFADVVVLERALAAPATYERLFGPGSPTGPEVADDLSVRASPTLLFAVLVHRAAEDLAEAGYVRERVGERLTVPVFDAPQLHSYLAAREQRLFLVDLLASYTRVVSGPQWIRRGGRWRRRRFSELEPTALAQVVLDAEDRDRPRLYCRLGDLSLFLTGVFADHVARRPVTPLELERLARTVREPLHPTVLGPRHSADLYEWLGPRWYRMGGRDEVADRFEQARRCLVFLTDRYLFADRDRLFPWRN